MNDGLYSKPDMRYICRLSSSQSNTYNVPDGIEEIGSYAFYLSDLEKINLPNSIRCIGDAAFELAGLCTMTLPDGVVSIGDHAFAFNPYLEEVVIPETVVSIGSGAFWECTALSEIHIPNSVVAIGDNPFAACDSLRTIIVSDQHPILEVKDGALFDKVDHRLVAWPCGQESVFYEVPAGTREIGAYAFLGCGIDQIILPESIVVIGDFAFMKMEDLTHLTIPSSVTQIGFFVFGDESKIENGVVQVESGSYAASYLENYATDEEGMSIYEMTAEKGEPDCIYSTEYMKLIGCHW